MKPKTFIINWSMAFFIILCIDMIVKAKSFGLDRVVSWLTAFFFLEIFVFGLIIYFMLKKPVRGGKG